MAPPTPPPQVLDAVLDCGLVPRKSSHRICEHNRLALTECAANHHQNTRIILHAKDPIYSFPGITIEGAEDFELSIESELRFVRPPKHQMQTRGGTLRPCLSFYQSHNLVITGGGLLHGGGSAWWGIPYLGFELIHEHRPKLLTVEHSRHVTLSHLRFQESPFYTIDFKGVEDATIHHLSILNARRPHTTAHGPIDLSAFNTDGIDVAGRNIHIHHVDIINQDDCIAIKDNSHYGEGVTENILVEHVNATGLGFSIGSIGGTTVRNVTIRDSLLYRTYKGIYIKFRDNNLYHGPTLAASNTTSNTTAPVSLVQDIRYENIVLVKPIQYAIWMGPAQQTNGKSFNPCYASPCSLCWPLVPGAVCHAPFHTSILENVILANVSIINPSKSPGVILGSPSSPIRNLIFENVVSRVDPHYTLDLDQTFPGLSSMTVQDHYVSTTSLVLGIALLILLCSLPGLCCGCCCYRYRSRRHAYSRLHDAEVAEYAMIEDEHDEAMVANDEDGDDEGGDENDENDVENDVESGDNGDDETSLENGEGVCPLERAASSLSADASPIELPSLRQRFLSTWSWLRTCGGTRFAKKVLVCSLPRACICFCLLLLVLMGSVVWRLRDVVMLVEDPDSYYVCEGVQKSVATGHTSPVPFCFRDLTTH